MKTFPHKLSTAKCKLSLPYFEEESKEEADAVRLMNAFTERLEEKILSYAGTSAVRSYVSDFGSDTENGVTSVRIRLSARLLSPSGKIIFRKREIICRWKEARLISVNKA